MSRKECSTCHSRELRRINRTGFWERTLFTRLGYYPWECVFCRKRVYFRDSGHAQRKRDAQPPPSRSQPDDRAA